MGDMAKRPKDLRWVRTERHLMDAIAQALAVKPLDRITVTELSRAAEINKATFYLHYRDVYDLAEGYVRSLARRVADEFGDLRGIVLEPRAFIDHMVGVLDSAETQARVTHVADNRLIPFFMEELNTVLAKRFQSFAPPDDDGSGHVAIAFFLHGVMGTLRQYRDTDRAALVEAIGGLMETLATHVPDRERLLAQLNHAE